MLRATPPGEDDLLGTRAVPVSFNAAGTPPGDDPQGGTRIFNAGRSGTAEPGQQGPDLELLAQQMAEQAGDPGDGFDGYEDDIDFLSLVRQAEDQALLYQAQVNRRAWSQSYRAFHQEHYIGSKYTRPDWRGRSRLFVPKTRTAVRKDQAAVSASLFNSLDAITCMPGNESDPMQRASAAVMQQLVNYRTSQTSGKASFAWFQVAIGARQNALITGVCLTKQCWKQEYRKTGSEQFQDPETGEMRVRETYALEIDRPDMLLVPPENYVIDPSADWTNPCQSAAFLIIKWPMQLEEIKAKQESPVEPWLPVDDAVLRSSMESGKYDMASIRRAREMGIDRLDETQTGTHFQIIWVYECFIRTQGQDWTFYSVGDQHYLTDPRPVRDVYPEQHGERPLALGYGNLEAHRIYPMSPVESWQPLQMETNDLRNLMLDATKQNVMPITKVVRGRQIDLDQVRRRSSGSSILVNNKDDVTWETPPQVPNSAVAMSRELDLELDDLSGQQNYGSVETNNALGKTLGGLKLAAGAANAVQEFDIRVWIHTWAAAALNQIVRLEQYYEADPIVLGLAGEKAKLFQKFGKYGITSVNDHLLEQDVTVRVSVGLGAGDPQQRLAKFQSAAGIVAPLLGQTKEFQSGKVELDWEALCDEVFGAVGYHDGGRRFFIVNDEAPQNPTADLETKKLLSEIEKNQRTGQAATFTGIAALAKVALGRRELEAEVVDRMLGRQVEAHGMGFDHAHRHMDQHLNAMDHGNRHGLAIAQHRHGVHTDARDAALAASESAAAGGGAGMAGAGDANGASAPARAAPPAPRPAPPPPAAAALPAPAGGQPSGPTPQQQMMELLRSGSLQFTRDPKTDRITGIRLPPPQGGANRYPTPPGM